MVSPSQGPAPSSRSPAAPGRTSDAPATGARAKTLPDPPDAGPGDAVLPPGRSTRPGHCPQNFGAVPGWYQDTRHLRNARNVAAPLASRFPTGEPFGEPTHADFRRQPAALNEYPGWSSAQSALLGDTQRRPVGDWGSRGRRFKSGRPDAGQKADPEFRVGLLSDLGPRSNVPGCSGPS